MSTASDLESDPLKSHGAESKANNARLPGGARWFAWVANLVVLLCAATFVCLAVSLPYGPETLGGSLHIMVCIFAACMPVFLVISHMATCVHGRAIQWIALIGSIVMFGISLAAVIMFGITHHDCDMSRLCGDCFTCEGSPAPPPTPPTVAVPTPLYNATLAFSIFSMAAYVMQIASAFVLIRSRKASTKFVMPTSPVLPFIYFVLLALVMAILAIGASWIPIVDVDTFTFVYITAIVAVIFAVFATAQMLHPYGTWFAAVVATVELLACIMMAGVFVYMCIYAANCVDHAGCSLEYSCLGVIVGTVTGARPGFVAMFVAITVAMVVEIAHLVTFVVRSRETILAGFHKLDADMPVYGRTTGLPVQGSTAAGMNAEASTRTVNARLPVVVARRR